MKGFYEQHREQEDRLYVFQRGKHLFPAHYHQNLEIFLLKKGAYVVTINGKKHRLTGGSVCVFDCMLMAKLYIYIILFLQEY